jgi:hypothetical protein
LTDILGIGICSLYLDFWPVFGFLISMRTD